MTQFSTLLRLNGAAVFGRDAGDCLTDAAVGLLYGLRGRARPAAATGEPSACEAAAAR